MQLASPTGARVAPANARRCILTEDTFSKKVDREMNTSRREVRMVRLFAMYPNKPDSKFDFDYYASVHMQMAKERLREFGLPWDRDHKRDIHARRRTGSVHLHWHGGL